MLLPLPKDDSVEANRVECDFVVDGERWGSSMSAQSRRSYQAVCSPRSILYAALTPSLPDLAGLLSIGWTIVASSAKYVSTFFKMVLASRGLRDVQAWSEQSRNPQIQGTPVRRGAGPHRTRSPHEQLRQRRQAAEDAEERRDAGLTR